MAKAFITSTLVRGKEPLLRRLVCEVRYQDGQLYLDRCGRLLKQLVGQNPEWVISPEPTTQGTSLFNLRSGSQLGFSISSASLSLDKSGGDDVIDADEVGAFMADVEGVLGTVLDELEVKRITRLGYREYHSFSFDSKEESESWLRGLGLISVSPALYESFVAAPDALGVSLTLQGDECRYRITLNGIEQSAQVPFGAQVLNIQASGVPVNQRKVLMERMKTQRQRQINSAFAVMLDIDAFLLEPDEPDLRAFVDEHSQNNLKRFREALPREQPRKAK